MHSISVRTDTTRDRFVRIVALVVVLWGARSSVAFQKDVGVSRLGTSDGQGSTTAECRLNFLMTPWPEVLAQVAKETGSELEMPEPPPGKFTRSDLSWHTREEAVRILNRDLHRVGFRLVAENERLVVSSTKRKQSEYPRWKSPEPKEQSPEQLKEEAGVPAARVQQVSHEVAGESASPKSVRVQPSRRKALDIAKQIHVTFKDRAILQAAGPNGFPAVEVQHFDEEAKAANRPLFVLEIDTEGDQLIVTAPADVQSALKQLIARLDENLLETQQTPTLVSGDGHLAGIGEQLKKPLSQIAQAQAAQKDTPGGVEAPGQAPAGDGGSLPELLGNLKGDVTIESLSDLDLLILRGNEKDVDAVLEVIRRIEQMAEGSLPEIHLLRLRFVDSESLAQLMNDVYERLSEMRTANAQQNLVSIQVVPVVIPNAVLILAPTNAIDGVLELANELDQPIDTAHQVEIFRLKHAVAASVVESLTTFYTQPPTGLGTRLKATADPRTNSVIVQASPQDLVGIREFIHGLDVDQADSVARLRVFQLKSAVASELASFLNDAIQSVLNPPRMSANAGTGGAATTTNTANQQARATVLEFLDEGRQELIRTGLLNEIRFNADPRTNSLMVTAPEQSMPLVEELVRMLDRPSEAVSEIKVFPLTNADATNAVTLLEELFNTQQNQQNQSGSSGLGVELMGAEGTGSSLIPLRFSVDARTNSVVAIGGAQALQIVEAILYKLDTNNARNRQTTVIKLRNSPVADVALAINEFLDAQRELATLDPDRISTSQLLEQEIIVTAEEVTNSLLISATPAYFKQLEEIARKLDAEPPQVMIQAMLVEVTLDNNDEFGVELGFQDPVLFARSAITDLVTTETTTQVPGVGNVQTTNIISQTAIPGFNFNNQPLGNNNSNTATNGIVGAQGLSNFNLGRTNNNLGYGGLVLSASSDAVSVLIRALAARRTVRVLSRPQVVALDNQTAQIQVGQVVPVPNGVNITATGLAQTDVLRDPAGIILTVSPRISPEGQIVMEVAAEKSRYPNLNSGVPIFTNPDGSVVYAPVKDITTARTTVKVPDGQTVVVGGMITKQDLSETRKVPWLGDLPMLGKLFRYDAFGYNRTELLIFLTPRIVHNDADAEFIKSVEAGRLHFFQDDAESIHGPIFGSEPEMVLPIEECPPLDVSPDLFPTTPMAPSPSPNSAEPPPLPPPGSTSSHPSLISPSSAARPIPAGSSKSLDTDVEFATGN